MSDISTPENKFRYALAIRDGRVQRVEFDDLRKGDQFRLYEWNGAAVDERICTAANDAKDGLITVDRFDPSGAVVATFRLVGRSPMAMTPAEQQALDAGQAEAKRPKINRDRSVTEYSDADLVKRAVLNAKPNNSGPAPRWVAISDTFALGSTFSYELCRIYGLDPDKQVPGPRCIDCDP